MLKFLPILITFALLISTRSVKAFWPNGPYYDVCHRDTSLCRPRNRDHRCQLFTDGAPNCFDIAFRQVKPPLENHNQADFVNKFFSFSFGVHLSEGTDQEFYYNLDRTECALLCIKSANNPPRFIRCLSFDYYPFETPMEQAPYFESHARGICVLNSGNRDTARLRNQDQGYTDSELFYKSHYTHRPFSNQDGYYEIRDPRGGEVSALLDYGASVDFAPIVVWGQSRWGISHLETPKPVDNEYGCENGDVVFVEEDDDIDIPTFYGGYTPINSDQRCAGIVTKPEAIELCQNTGGELCPDLQTLQNLEGRKLGCGLDGEAIWHHQRPDDGGKAFVRCCARYGIVDNCDFYEQDNINTCSSYNNLNDCVSLGSGSRRQRLHGFGNLLIQFRKDCEQDNQYCKGLTKNGEWSPRDRCVWCLNPNGEGSCRPGNDFGICPNAMPSTKALFALKMKATCGAFAICRLANEFEDLMTVLSVPTNSPTKAPSPSPTPPTEAPTFSPTRSPTPFPCANVHKRATRVVARNRCLNNSESCRWNGGTQRCVPLSPPVEAPSTR